MCNTPFEPPRPASLALQYVQITVLDFDESLAFYRDALGLELVNDLGSGDKRWVNLTSPTQPGLEYVLSRPHAGRSKEDGDALQAVLVKGILPMLVFTTDDLDATFERVKASGAEVLQEPVDRPWGPRDSAFRDPSGTTVRIQQGEVRRRPKKTAPTS
ncbi:VOC family protein [Nocardia sp. XZ_19_385]|uniref:VOC family protein n=1 Tax=Nocardia sp. XZ_19_385 TaxID=2769488 RepID=UPI0018906966|nr:VOC family protein [Nocardia sp. XZ_19_385]